jgi:hypothetical protein
VEDRILVLDVPRGLSERYSHLRTWITRQRPFPTFLQVCDDLVMEELTQGVQPRSLPVAGPSSSSTALVATPPPVSSLLGPPPPSRPSGGKGGRGGRRRRGGRGHGTTPPPPRAPSAPGGGTPWPSFSNPWAGRISMWPFQAPRGAHRPPAATMFTDAPVAPLSSPWTPPPGAQPGPIGWDPAALARSFNTMTLLLQSTRPGSPTRVPLTTPLSTPVYFLLCILLLPLTPRPSWSQMVRVFLSLPWAPLTLTDPFASPMFLWPPLWFTTSFLFVVLQLTILVLSNLTLLVLL